MKKTRCENCDCEINYLLKAPRFCKSRECQAVYKEIKRRMEKIKEINSSIKKLIKNPFKNKKDSQTKYIEIKIDNIDLKFIKDYIENNCIKIDTYYIYDSKIEIYFRGNEIQLNAKREYIENL